MEKLYLIRIDMESFLGPFTLRQVKEAYGRMEFGLQDEVAGSLRQWVAFDDVEGIKRHYPELINLVQKEMLSGWGVSAYSPNGQSAAPVKLKNPAPEKSRKLSFFLVLLASLLLSGIGFVLWREGSVNNVLEMLRDRQLYMAKSLYGEAYNGRFEGYMDRNRESINQALKKKKTSQQWLTFVRAVAFEKDGRWEGVSQKKLRGQVESFLPQDCSMTAWELRWTQSKNLWSRYLDGQEFPKEDWAILLALDPAWIVRRSPSPGWMKPGSYAEACLSMALKSLQRISGEDTPWESKVFISRLRWQIGVIHSQSSDEDFEMSGTLWSLSCLEDAQNETAIKNCQGAVNPKQGWRDELEFATQRRKIELLLGNQTLIPTEKLQILQGLLAEAVLKVRTVSVPWEAELRFYQEIIEQVGDVEKARSLTLQKYPQLNFAH